MDLLDKTLENFEPLLRSIHAMAFSSGLRELRNLRISQEELKTADVKVKRRYLRCCLKGFNKAQQRIASEVIKLNELKQRKKAELAESRPRGDKSVILNLEALIDIIDNRILVLRRLLDAVAFTLFDRRTEITRRFWLLPEINGIDNNVVLSNLKEANRLNELDPLSFALVSDLTTFIQVGDLVQLDVRSHKIRILELKKGKVNKLIKDLLEDPGTPLTAEGIEAIGQKFGSHTSKQIKRVIRQKERMKKIADIVEKREGEDVRGIYLKFFGAEIVTSHYIEPIIKAIEEARIKGACSCIIDDCLTIVSIKGSSREALHHFYHLRFPDTSCAFISGIPEKIDKEVEDIRTHCTEFTEDFVSGNMTCKS